MPKLFTLVLLIGLITQTSNIHAGPFEFYKDVILSADETVHHNEHSSIVENDNLYIQSISETDGHTVKVINLTSGNLVKTLTHPKKDQIKWIEFGKSIQANEQYIAVSAYTESHYSGPRRQGEIHIYDAKEFKHLWELRSPKKSRSFGFA